MGGRLHALVPGRMAPMMEKLLLALIVQPSLDPLPDRTLGIPHDNLRTPQVANTSGLTTVIIMKMRDDHLGDRLEIQAKVVQLARSGWKRPRRYSPRYQSAENHHQLPQDRHGHGSVEMEGEWSIDTTPVQARLAGHHRGLDSIRVVIPLRTISAMWWPISSIVSRPPLDTI